MTRTEEVRKHFHDKDGALEVTAQALVDINVTLAMLYDLMKETQKRDNPMDDDLK